MQRGVFVGMVLVGAFLVVMLSRPSVEMQRDVNSGPRGSSRDRAAVSADDFGEEWPFTIPGGRLTCQREGSGSDRAFVTLDDGNGVMYALNGSARSFGFPDHASILKPGKTRADVQPLIGRGLALCETR